MNCKIIIFALSLVFISCDKTYETPDEIAEIEMEVRVKRFDQDFYNIKDNSFEKLKKEYEWKKEKLNYYKNTTIKEM